MKKVLVFTSVHIWNDTRIFYKQVSSLAKKYNVEYHAPAEFKIKKINNISIIGLPQWKSFYDRIKLNIILFLRIVKSNADIFHFHDFELIIIGLYIKIIKRKPVIFDIHENYMDQIKHKTQIPFLLKNIISSWFSFFNKYLINLFYIIFAESSYKKLFSNISSSKFETILNLPILEIFDEFKIEDRSQNIDLFYIGALTPERGFNEMLQIIDELNSQKIYTNLHLVGPNWYKLKLSKNFTHIKDQIKFYGRMDLKEGYTISKNCLIGLCILHPIENYIESYPTKIFEFMACSLPVITSNFSLYKKIVQEGDCGICVDYKNIKDIANSIKFLINNPLKAIEFGKNGRLLVEEKFNWDLEEKKLLNFYKNIS